MVIIVWRVHILHMPFMLVERISCLRSYVLTIEVMSWLNIPLSTSPSLFLSLPLSCRITSYLVISSLILSCHILSDLILSYSLGAGSATEATEDGMVETERHTRLRPYEILLRKFNYQQVHHNTSYEMTSHSLHPILSRLPSLDIRIACWFIFIVLHILFQLTWKSCHLM